MKKLLVSSTILFSSLLAAQAVNTTYSLGTGGGGLNYVTSSGSALANGSLVRVGAFDVSGANDAVIRNSNIFGDVDQHFTPVGEGLANAGAPDQVGGSGGTTLVINGRDGAADSSGELTGAIDNIGNDYFAGGTQLYVWVFNGPTPETSSEWGIFSRSIWLDKDPSSPFVPIAVVAINTTGDTSDFEALRGTVDAGGSGLRLDVVPEPSAALLLVAALGAFGLRRRR